MYVCDNTSRKGHKVAIRAKIRAVKTIPIPKARNPKPTQDPHHAAAVERGKAAVRKLQEQAVKAERLVGEARQQLEAQNLTGAFRSASEALEADPENARANQVISLVHSEMERRDARRRLDEGLNRAKTLVLLQTYDEAIALLTDLAASNPNEPAIADLLDGAQREKDQQERRQRPPDAGDHLPAAADRARYEE